MDIISLQDVEDLGVLAVNDVHLNGSWDKLAFGEFLPAEVICWFCDFSFHFSKNPDLVVWEPTTFGQFALSLAYI